MKMNLSAEKLKIYIERAKTLKSVDFLEKDITSKKRRKTLEAFLLFSNSIDDLIIKGMINV